MGVPEEWLHKHLVHPKPRRKIYMAEYMIFGLHDGWLIGIPFSSLEEVYQEIEWMEGRGFKKPRFQETFTPVDCVVVKREKHDKQTKTGKDMWRFYCREGDGTGTEHLVIAFDPTEFKKGDKVTVSMGSFGKQAKHKTDGADWDEDVKTTPDLDDIPF